jgi:hyperosmotically inducible protein
MRFKKQYIAGILLLSGSLVMDARMTVQAMPQDAQQPAPDNSKTNQNDNGPTADQQKNNTSDQEITRQIRKSIHADNSLSTYGHNVKIVTQSGKVTLRGPVRSDDEKSNIEAKAVAVAGQGNVDDQLNVAPPKS